MPSFPLNILLSLPEYISNYIGKITTGDEVSAHEVSDSLSTKNMEYCNIARM